MSADYENDEHIIEVTATPVGGTARIAPLNLSVSMNCIHNMPIHPTMSI